MTKIAVSVRLKEGKGCLELVVDGKEPAAIA